jgi:hypothetical protein
MLSIGDLATYTRPGVTQADGTIYHVEEVKS